MSGAKGHTLECCMQCIEDYCRNCSDAENPNDFCSQECQDKNYAPITQEELDAEGEEERKP